MNNDYSQLYTELKQKLNKENLLNKTPVYGVINLVITLGLFFGGLVFIDMFPIWLITIYYYILIVELGFISHDLIHNQYFKSIKINTFWSHVTGNLCIGLSQSWWRKKHNVEHHTFTNSDIYDTDIRDYDEIFTNNKGKYPFYNKHRRVLFWLSTSILYFNLIFLSYSHIYKNKRY